MEGDIFLPFQVQFLLLSSAFVCACWGVKSYSTLEVKESVRTFSSPKSVNTPPHSQGMQHLALFAFAFAFV